MKSFSLPSHKQSSLLAIATTKKDSFTVHFFVAGDEGIEPPTAVLETEVMPLN